MKITDEVIVKFFGNGRGFVMVSIKRWGGFVSHEDDLEHAQFCAIRSAVSAKNRELEFENEVHMVNYLMKTCYWGWCEAVKKRLETPVVLESQLIPDWADDDYVRPDKFEESVEPKEIVLNPHRLHEVAKRLVLHKLGPTYARIFELHHVNELALKEISKEIGLSVSTITTRLSTIRRLLHRRFKSFANRNYHYRLGQRQLHDF
jgi:hypothetical protein